MSETKIMLVEFLAWCGQRKDGLVLCRHDGFEFERAREDESELAEEFLKSRERYLELTECLAELFDEFWERFASDEVNEQVFADFIEQALSEYPLVSEAVEIRSALDALCADLRIPWEDVAKASLEMAVDSVAIQE